MASLSFREVRRVKIMAPLTPPHRRKRPCIMRKKNQRHLVTGRHLWFPMLDHGLQHPDISPLTSLLHLSPITMYQLDLF